MIRRFDDPIDHRQSYRNRIGAYAVIADRDRVMLTFQAGVHQEYQLPGGGVDPGESPLQALHREIREETGWRVADPVRLGSFQRYTEMPEYGIWARKVCLIYRCTPVYAKWPISEPDHVVEWMRWPEALAVLANAGDRHFLAQAFR